jgi:putative exosortase-associated protein (TIGR04073 family)
MRVFSAMFSLIILIALAAPAFAQEEPKPEGVVGKMAVKLTRGVTNVATAPVEIPKQTIKSIRDMGAVGAVIGPLKGVGMTVYRAIVGSLETLMFMAPQPGYYDPMTDPDYVWKDWEKPKSSNNYVKAKDSDSPED